MSLEMQAGIRPVRLFGIQYSPNPAAEEVERYLRVPFPVKPLRVIMDMNHNRRIGLVLTVNLFVLRGNFDFGSARRVAAKISNIDINGAGYSPLLHTIFDRSNRCRGYINRHENAHGWVASMNKALRVTKLIEEKGIVLCCVNEGVAEWCARRITSIVNPGKKDENAYACPVPTAGKFTQIFIPRIRRNADVMLNSVARYNEGLRTTTSSALYDDSYETGLYFVSTAIDYLENHGVPENEILVALVQNPPATINQLANPLGFAEDLLALH